MQINPSLFYYQYKDKQLLGNIVDMVFGPLPLLVNAPESRVIGAELDVQVNPLDGLFLALAASLLDTKVEEYTGINRLGDEQDFSGEKFNFAPETELTLLANYILPLNERYDASLGVDYAYTGSTNSSLGGESEFAHDDYFLLNARIGIETVDGRWRASLWGRNITDELATTSVQKIHDTFTRYVGMTRTYGLSVSWSLQ